MTEVLREIGMIARALDSISNVEFKDLALSKGQYLYLVRIYENPGIIQEELANLLKVDKTTASRALKKLMTAGLIMRQNSDKNQKNKHLFVTAQGKELYAIIKRENDHSEKMALTGLTASEKVQLEQLLTKVCQNVAQDWKFVKQGGKRKY
ncbi:MarR family winged helix-turn-helix transcriptional regulator [Ligilactobacillus apodemi]|uniref:MarR family transcriptional regulator n=1 Tax=Ligilactobacillus apodemi DSM 16634 = JCM 16172 TaxID=1423724 RepID=A0A0R1U0X1_9LACO|nr:MarR family transcriptional regulator [Ligilactobacillus apodemi]KRL87120.1 MarR family transcriptional regulator [Ligilactobacillus apodemi DSM 16634 = JCM 16172]